MNSEQQNDHWQFWVDVGGTFTDCFAIDPSGTQHALKLLSSGVSEHHTNMLGPGCEELPSPILAAHLLTEIPLDSPLPVCSMHLGTTRGTNALLTRTGAKTALVTSKGLRDFLTIGDQTRPELFELTVRKPTPLFEESIEINERVLHDGTVELAPDPNELHNQLLQLKSRNIESLAICLMHSFKYPDHELLVGRVAEKIGFRSIRLSSQVTPLIKIVPRGETTVLDAYLNPVLAEYLDEIETRLGAKSSLKLMTSAGTLTSRSSFSGKDSVLSGPASGVVGAARVAQQIGFQRSIGFDMGGTSTDVCRFDGQFKLEFETRKAGVQIMTPVMAIETVAAGGGSICSFDGTRLTVGPESAGADPGPACYGKGGPLTVTDINLYLGRLDSHRFPLDLDFDSVSERLEAIAAEVAEANDARTLSELATGFLRIANHNMAAAVRTVSVSQGFDPRDYVMVSFGGAGGQHCCEVAECLGINTILVHPKSSILSAYGIRLASQSRSQVQSVLQPLTSGSTESALDRALEMSAQLKAALLEEGCRVEPVSETSLDLRYQGTDTTINLVVDAETDIETAFQNEHRRRFGYSKKQAIEIANVRVTVTEPGHALEQQSRNAELTSLKSEQFQSLWSGGQKVEAAKFNWQTISANSKVVGPAIVGDSLTSTIIDAGWQACVLQDKQLLITRILQSDANRDQPKQSANSPDPVELEIFNSSFRSIAEQMGHVLRNTAISANVKERLDYSCALFAADGDLVVNAPHIPVHLGAMSETVRATIHSNALVQPGDVFVTNDPYAGGSHLPDVTVLTPVFCDDLPTPSLWVASRAHHAEIGGIAPGSMPANARHLEQEGVLIRNFKLIASGEDYFAELLDLLSKSTFPSRNPEENISDIQAQVAANQSGVNAINELIAAKSLSVVLNYMSHIRKAAEIKTRQAIESKIADGKYPFEDQMDDGTCIKVLIEKSKDQLQIDFAGTSPQHTGNLNANPAIVSSAILYVMRCLISEDIPLNSGVLAPVTIRIPNDSFLNPQPAEPHGQSPAVVGGNVETSQRVVDVLLGALGIAAASQGTMNNWLIGDSSFGYYETVGGGSGATSSGDGADAVHCHMSNTRLTDPEVLETRYPVVLRKFKIRANSGGAGQHHGGNGMVREIEFRRPLTLSLLTSRRSSVPFGQNGGGPAMPGQNLFIAPDGSSTELPSQCERSVNPGDRLRLLTPGGGGFGVTDP